MVAGKDGPIAFPGVASPGSGDPVEERLRQGPADLNRKIFNEGLTDVFLEVVLPPPRRTLHLGGDSSPFYLLQDGDILAIQAECEKIVGLYATDGWHFSWSVGGGYSCQALRRLDFGDKRMA